jgi:hypothetical protein
MPHDLHQSNPCPRRAPGSSASGAPAIGHEPGIDPTERFPATLVTRGPVGLLPTVETLGGTAVASGSGRT